MNKENFIKNNEDEAYFAFSWSNAAAAFLKAGRFKKVIFSGAWGDFKFISEFAEFITALDFQNEDRDLSGVAALRNLRSLHVRGRFKNSVAFSNLKLIESCTVPWRSDYATSLFSAQNLHDATIESFSENDFSSIFPNHAIKCLTLSKPNNTSLAGIKSLSNLEEVEIDNATKLTDVFELSTLLALRKVRILNAKKIVAFPDISMIQSLESLILSNVGGISDICFLYALKKLATISIGGEPVKVDWEKLLALPAIKLIHILVAKESCPSEQELIKYIATAKKKASSFKLVTTKAAAWTSVQIKFE